MGIIGSCGRIYLEQALSANSWLISQPHRESSLLQCPVGCEGGCSPDLQQPQGIHESLTSAPCSCQPAAHSMGQLVLKQREFY